MIVMVVALVVGCVLEYFFTRERITEDNIKNAEAAANGEENKPLKKVTMGQQIRVCLKDKAWWLLMIFWFLSAPYFMVTRMSLKLPLSTISYLSI